MCNGESIRQSGGGTIAILKSAPSSPAPCAETSLLLADDYLTGATTATLSGASTPPGLERQVVIQ